MYNFTKYRNRIILLLLGFIIVLLIFSALTWNILLMIEKSGYVILLVTFIILLLLITLLLFAIAYKLSNKKKFDNYITEIKTAERNSAIAETERKKESEIIEDKKDIEVEAKNKLSTIIPNLKGIKSLKTFSEKLLTNLAKELEIVQGLCYIKNKTKFTVSGKYAFTTEDLPADFKPGETLPGQAAENSDIMIIDEIPEDYFQVESGLGKTIPKHLIFIPVIQRKKTIALLELASFKSFNELTVNIFNKLKDQLGENFAKFIK